MAHQPSSLLNRKLSRTHNWSPMLLFNFRSSESASIQDEKILCSKNSVKSLFCALVFETFAHFITKKALKVFGKFGLRAVLTVTCGGRWRHWRCFFSCIFGNKIVNFFPSIELFFIWHFSDGFITIHRCCCCCEGSKSAIAMEWIISLQFIKVVGFTIFSLIKKHMIFFPLMSPNGDFFCYTVVLYSGQK